MRPRIRWRIGFSLRAVLRRLRHRGVPAFLAATLASISVFAAGVVRASGAPGQARTATATFGVSRTLAGSGLFLNSQEPVAAINASGE
jgi:hypothetical protein